MIQRQPERHCHDRPPRITLGENGPLIVENAQRLCAADGTDIAACPSGALRVSLGERAPQHMTTGDVAIAIERNGPFHVTTVALDAKFNGVGAARSKYTRCRCGLSKNKAFCDGSHHDAKWSDDDTDPTD